MARRKRLVKIIFGIFLGIIFSQLFVSDQKTLKNTHCNRDLKTFPLENPGNNPSPLSSPIVHRREPETQTKASAKENLLFVGVMTAAKYLETRAKTVYETWGKEVPGKVMFYSSENSYSESVPLVALEGVDDSYPPQKKSFMMIKNMYENYVDEYEWFLRADDDVYIRTDKLEELLHSVDSRKPWFIGQTGRGNNEEFGLLSLDSDENFCMGGPGVILSRETLRRIAPYVEECLQNLYTTHEDVELGRCVRRFAGISCTWSYEASETDANVCACKMQVILYHNQSGEAAFSGDLKQKEVHRAITLHPVKQPHHMHRLHKYVKGLRLQTDQQKVILLHRDLAASMKELGYRIERIATAYLVENLPLFPEVRGSRKYMGDTSLLGIATSMNRYSPESLKDILEWELISRTLYTHRDFNPRKRIGSSLKEGLGDIVREIMELINSYSQQRGRVIDFKEILYGYWRLDPLHGADLILDLLLVYKKYRGHKMTVQVRRHAYVQQTFTGIFIREVSDNPITLQRSTEVSTELLPVHKRLVHQLFSKITKNLQPLLSSSNSTTETLINFVLPLSGRYDTFARFLKNYEDICVKDHELTILHVVLYRNDKVPSDYEKTKQLVNTLNKNYKNSDIRIFECDNQQFTRGIALQNIVNILNDGDLMLFIDVDIIFTSRTLQRLRKNTKLSRSVYFPIVYSLYNPKLLNRTYHSEDYTYFTQNTIIDNYNGFWRQFGFGIVSLYKKDYTSLGGFNLDIKGWGNEDVTFFDNAVKSDLKIVRSVDAGLIHVYHEVKCESDLNLEQMNMCLGTKASTLGSFCKLQDFFVKYRELFR